MKVDVVNGVSKQLSCLAFLIRCWHYDILQNLVLLLLDS